VLVLLLVGCTLTPITPTPPDATQTELPNTEVPTATPTATVDTVDTPTPTIATPTPIIGTETATPLPTLADLDWWVQPIGTPSKIRTGPGVGWPCITNPDKSCRYAYTNEVVHVRNIIIGPPGETWLQLYDNGEDLEAFIAWEHPDCEEYKSTGRHYCLMEVDGP